MREIHVDPAHLNRARQFSADFASLPQVEAVALGGSHGGGVVDASSDIDLYVYTRNPIPVEDRGAIVEKGGGAARSSLDLNYWGPGDEWIDALTGIEIDIVYFESAWMENQIQRVIDLHIASLGFSTCFWHTIRQSICLYDRQGWFKRLQTRCRVDYPEQLRHNIIALNHPVLRGIIPSYFYQIEKAVKRSDIVSINHRLSALLASYFDILFAVNRLPHPGEKRMLEFALDNCETRPVNLVAETLGTLSKGCTDLQEFLPNLTILLDHLDQWLSSEGFATLVADSNKQNRIG